MAHDTMDCLEEGDLRCYVCNAIYTTQNGLDTHISTLHGNFECGNCKKTFTNKYRLERHIKTIHGVPDRPFTCSICDARFMHKQGKTLPILGNPLKIVFSGKN